MDWKKDSYLAVFLLILSGFIFYRTMEMPSASAFFPELLSILLAVLSVLLLISSIRKRGTEADNEQAAKEEKLVLPVVLIIASLILYGILLQYFGFIIATLVVVNFVIFATGYKKYIKGFLIACTTTSVIFVVFQLLLNVRLPAGVFFS
ncbi:tripartite tricarboxylate transporter TctB family protein [Gracilibacillus sp. S3-1-1]|uniref:Tripartite tricarboxylate transporter TctB family protein n=1 Tax=Gracilibacillus pellucidus TaxID=3095368 RepID=A0ACC6M8J4_9BACI|nr:tripartite tricarboxylate transporter TctB family protein [Gracilibacillus sp. S3-1-1]MDX8047264.1 tripartite tricarboxylate transporter TctB family protein [Gracilibacillus sp. S3-1-1]